MLKRILAIVLLAGAALFILSSSSISSEPIPLKSNHKTTIDYYYTTVESEIDDEQIITGINIEVNSYHYEDEKGAFYFNLTIDNNTNRTFGLAPNANREIEFKGDDGQWYIYKPSFPFASNMILAFDYYSYPNTTSDYEECSLYWPYNNTLPKGEYRLLIEVDEFDEEYAIINHEQPQYFAAEFEVK